MQLVVVRIFSQDLVINEVSYANKTTIIDSDGDSPDWIEIYNPINEAINLAGYQITDDLSDSALWTFPNLNLEAKSYLLIFASGKNKTIGNEFHTDFRLCLMQDSLFLLNPQGTVIDQVNAECVPKDLSIGYQPDGSSERYIIRPTPGTSNDTAEIIQINFQPDTLMVNHASGFYTSPIELSFTHTNKKNNVYFTLDGDIPDVESEEYTNVPIYLEDLTPNKNRFANIPETYKKPGDGISKANIVRALVYSDGCPASNVISNTYFIGKHLKEAYNVSVISLITEADNLFDDDIGIYVEGNNKNYNNRGKEWERPLHVEMFDALGKQFIEQDAGVRISGRGSRSAPQKPLRLYAREKYGKEYFEYSFFEQKPELERFETLLLRSTSGLSGTIFKDELTQNLVQDMRIDCSGTLPVIVFLNGEYWGIYSMRERLDEGYVENNYKVTKPEIDVISHNLHEISLEKGSWDEYDKFISYIKSADPLDEVFFEQVSEMIDIPQTIDYYVAELYFANYDFPHNNVKLWKTKSDTALWRHYFYDCDACMILSNQNLFTELNNLEIELFQKHSEWAVIIIQQLLQNPQFRNMFMMKYYYHLQNTFSPEKVINEINRLESVYKPMVAEHTYRWHQPEDYIKWSNNVEMLRIFAMQRPKYVVEQLKDNFKNPFTLYPNPSKGEMNITAAIEDIGVFELVIIDISGKVVFRQSFTESQNSFYSNLQPGMYFTQYRYDGLVFTEKLIMN